MHDQPLHATPCTLMKYFLALPLVIWDLGEGGSHTTQPFGPGGTHIAGDPYRGGSHIAGEVISRGKSYRGGSPIAGGRGGLHRCPNTGAQQNWTGKKKKKRSNQLIMAVTGLLTALVVIFSLRGARAFVPNRALNFFLDGQGTTHKKMTEDAIVEVTVDLLRDNPNPDPTVDSTRKINALSAVSPASLIRAYYGSRQRVSAFRNAIDDIAEANSDVDTGTSEGNLAEAHFDSEQFQAGQNRLTMLNRMMINEIKLCRFRSARKLAGRALHTLQDFYSHSNWVEMGRNDPYSILGKPMKRPENVAPRTMRTCTDCTRTKIGTYQSISFSLGLRKTEYAYTCNDNILAEINRKGVLTSGYYAVDNGEPKPARKCSHGGWRDSTSDRSATGGINKDSLDSS